MKKICVAVDGTAGSGKTFIFNQVGEEVGYNIFDTGLLYRAFTYFLYLKKVDFSDSKAVIKALRNFDFTVQENRVFLNQNLDITNYLASSFVTDHINEITPILEVRDFMTKIERKIGYQPGTIELGRDITTVVLPNADLKIYLDSPLEVRAQRRYQQNLESGIDEDYDLVYQKISKRDLSDKTREIGPLKLDNDAWYLDTSEYDPSSLVKIIVAKIRELESELS